jgi:hypothetical protein
MQDQFVYVRNNTGEISVSKTRWSRTGKAVTRTWPENWKEYRVTKTEIGYSPAKGNHVVLSLSEELKE